MHPKSRRRLRPRRNESPAGARKKVSKEEARDQRAQQRFHLARFVREATGSLRQRQAALVAAVREPEGSLHAIMKTLGADPERFSISHEQVRIWMKRDHDEVSVEGLTEARKSGRPPVPFPEALDRFFRDAILTARYPSARSIWIAMREKADALGIEAPTYDRVKRAYNAVPHAQHVAARHGKAAVIADATVHSTVGAKYPHEFWALDEMTIPVWVKVYLQKKRVFLATKVDVCLVIDLCSEVVVGYHIVNPILRGVTRGVDSDDVLGAVASACFPEVASEACRPYAGFLPTTLRFDRGAWHNETGARMERLGVHVPDLPGYGPWRNGAVEAAVGALKGLCTEILGYDEKWAVAEYEREEGYARRRRIAATMTRLPTHVPATIEQLHTVQRLREEFEKVVRRYNRELEHSHWGVTRESRYYETLDLRKTRAGRDALSILDLSRVTVSDRGMVVAGIPYATQAGAISLPMNEIVTVRIDPLRRGVFVDAGEMWVWMPPKEEWARGQNPADIAKAQNEVALEYSRLSREARERYQEDMLGPEDAALASAVARETLSAEKKRAPREAPAPPAKRSARHAAPARPRPADEEREETPPLAPLEPPPLRLVAGGGGAAPPRGIAKRPISLVRPTD